MRYFSNNLNFSNRWSERCSRSDTWAYIIIIWPNFLWLIIFFWTYGDQTPSTIAAWDTIHAINRAVTIISTIIIIIRWGSWLLAPEKCLSITTLRCRICRPGCLNKAIVYSCHQFFMICKVTTPTISVWNRYFSICIWYLGEEYLKILSIVLEWMLTGMFKT